MLSWMNLGRSFLNKACAKRRTQFREGLKALRANPDAGNVEELWTIERGAGRFLLSRIASGL
jgi:hypothetical protein